MADQCVFVRPDGSRCRYTGKLDAAGTCANHSIDPATREAMQASRRRGGEHTAARVRRLMNPQHPPAPRTIADVLTWSSWVAEQLAAGALDPKIAHEIGLSLTLWLRAQRYDERMKTLEQALAAAMRQAKRAA